MLLGVHKHFRVSLGRWIHSEIWIEHSMRTGSLNSSIPSLAFLAVPLWYSAPTVPARTFFLNKCFCFSLCRDDGAWEDVTCHWRTDILFIKQLQIMTLRVRGPLIRNEWLIFCPLSIMRLPGEKVFCWVLRRNVRVSWVISHVGEHMLCPHWWDASLAIIQRSIYYSASVRETLQLTQWESSLETEVTLPVTIPGQQFLGKLGWYTFVIQRYVNCILC